MNPTITKIPLVNDALNSTRMLWSGTFRKLLLNVPTNVPIRTAPRPSRLPLTIESESSVICVDISLNRYSRNFRGARPEHVNQDAPAAHSKSNALTPSCVQDDSSRSACTIRRVSAISSREMKWRRHKEARHQITYATAVDRISPVMTGKKHLRASSTTGTRANPATAMRDDHATRVPPPAQILPI